MDSRPQFSFEQVWDRKSIAERKFLSERKFIAEVTLPLFVDPTLRVARSIDSWNTERMAAKDASFEAYRALHVAGLVNDNLLPWTQETNDQMAEFQIKDNTPSLVHVAPTLDPWVSVADSSRCF